MLRLLFIAVALAVAAPVSARSIEAGDIAKIASLASPAISPDGKNIVYVETHRVIAGDTSLTALVIVDVASGARRELTQSRHGVAQPAWSPTDGEVAFLADDDRKHPQIFLLPLGGGDARQITRTHEGVQQYAWRPDGEAFAYVTRDDAPDAAAVKAHHDFFSSGNNDYLATSIDPPSHLWLARRNGGPALRLTEGKWSLATSYPPSPPASPLSWSPDGKSLLFTRVPDTRDGDAYRSQIMLLDVATKAVHGLTGHARFEGFAAFAPDGKRIVYLANRNDDPNNENAVFLTTPAGGPGRDISATLDRNVVRAEWTADGSALLVGAHDGARNAIWLLSTDGTSRRIDTADVNPAQFFWLDATTGRDGAIAFVGAQPHHPSELWYLGAAAAAAKPLTDVNHEVAALDLGQVEEIRYDGPDGFAEDGVLTYPPGFAAGKIYPLVLYVHGGPTSASTVTFAFLQQLMAARGYVVFEPNYRGSDNANNAFARAIYMDAGAGPGRDVMAGLAAVEAKGFVDKRRVAVTGWSYGGYMTSWLMTHYHVWNTAISGAAVNNWVDMYDFGDGNVQVAFAFRGSPYVGNNMRDYVAQSPLTYAAQTRCPVLIVSDTADVRVPITQSYEMFHALTDNHVAAKFVAIPVGGHYPSDVVRVRELYALWLSWLDAHLRG